MDLSLEYSDAGSVYAIELLIIVCTLFEITFSPTLPDLQHKAENEISMLEIKIMKIESFML